MLFPALCPNPGGWGWATSPRGWLWGAHVSLCPTAGSALFLFKPPSQQRVPSAPSLRAWFVNAEPLTALALCYGHCLLPITLASGLPGKEHPSPREALPLQPLHKEVTHSSQHPIALPGWGGVPRIRPVCNPPECCFWFFGAYPAPPVPLQHPALLHLSLQGPCRDTLSLSSTPGCPAPPCTPPGTT